MLIEEFKHSITLVPRFSDADLMGHVNNARYITYLEEARIQYARDVFEWDGSPNKIGMILAKTTMDYLMPVEVGNMLKIYTRCSRIGRKSFDLSYLMVMGVGHQLVSTALTTMVAYDYAHNSSVLVSDEWREKVLAYEKTPPTIA